MLHFISNRAFIFRIAETFTKYNVPGVGFNADLWEEVTFSGTLIPKLAKWTNLGFQYVGARGQVPYMIIVSWFLHAANTLA